MDPNQNFIALQEALVRADAAGDTEAAQSLANQLKQWQQPQAAPQAAPKDEGNFFTNFGDRIKAGTDSALDAAGMTANVLGAEGVGETLTNAMETPEDYVSPSEQFANADGSGYKWEYLPGMITEQMGQFAGSVVARALGVAGGAAVGSAIMPGYGTAAGSAIGGFAGPAVFEAVQVVGPVAMELAQKNGRAEPNADDMRQAYLTASAQGGLNAIAPGAQGFIKRMFLEGATETGQAFIEQGGTSLNTPEGIAFDTKQALAEGIAGAGSAGTVDTAIGAAKVPGQAYTAVKESRYDTLDEAGVRAAERIANNADGGDKQLANVFTRDPDTSAQGPAKTALEDIRLEAKSISKGLNALAKYEGSEDAAIAVDKLVKSMGNMKSAVPQDHMDAVRDAFPSNTDAVDALIDLAMQARHVQKFTVDSGHLGGISNKTRRLDVTDGRNSGLSVASAAMAAGALGLGGGMMAAPTGTVINRVARGVDRVTNNLSPIARFVESGRRQTKGQAAPSSPRYRDPNQMLKKMKADEKATKEAKKTERFEYESRAYDQAFETNTINPDLPEMAPYVMWEKYTGMDMQSMASGLAKLEAAGTVPRGTAYKFRYNPRAFKTKKGDPESQVTYDAQALLRQNYNPDWKPPVEPTEQQAKLDPKVTGDKKKEGKRTFQNVTVILENMKGALKREQYQALLQLRNEINSPKMTQDKRFELINKSLPSILKDDADLMSEIGWHFDNLAGAGLTFIPEGQKAEKEVTAAKALKKVKRPPQPKQPQ